MIACPQRNDWRNVLKSSSTKMDLEIRAAEEGDHAEIAAIYAFEPVISQTSQIPLRNAGFWAGFYKSTGMDCIELVALAHNRTAGHMGILLNNNPRKKHVASFGIAVHPKFQRKGIGRALMNVLVDMADNWLNLQKLELDVSTDNTAAISLYQSFDFVIEGEFKYDLFKQGEYSNTYKMARFNPKLPAAVAAT